MNLIPVATLFGLISYLSDLSALTTLPLNGQRLPVDYCPCVPPPLKRSRHKARSFFPRRYAARTIDSFLIVN